MREAREVGGSSGENMGFMEEEWRASKEEVISAATTED